MAWENATASIAGTCGLPELRRRMVDEQLVRRGIRDHRVLAAMGEVPREAFMPPASLPQAYEDGPVPIEAGQTISQPYMVALMAEAGALGPEDLVLEVGTGSGYAAAVLARLCRRVVTIERHAALADRARANLSRLGIDNVEVRLGDGSAGCAGRAPFHAVLVAAGGPGVPQELKDQLAPGGRLVMPVGDAPRRQRLVKLVRLGANEWSTAGLGKVLFVPLIGVAGWRSDPGREHGPAVAPARL